MRESEDDIGADIRNALEGLQTAPTPAPTEGASDETQAFEPPKAPDNRTRDEAGKFAPKETVASTEKPAQSDPASLAPATEPPSETIPPPPHGLKAALKASWTNLPPDVREEFVRLEQETAKGKNEWQSKGERLNKIDAVIEPLQHRLQMTGVDPVDYIKALSSADDRLRGPGKVEALAELARFYGIDLQAGQQTAPQQQQFNQFGQPQPQQQFDPAYQALLQKVSGLEQTLTQQQQLAQRAEGQRQAQEEAALQGEVGKFREENIYFDNVKTTMASLLRSGEATDLKDAYDKACWVSPEIRTLLQAPVTPKPATAQAPGKQPVLSVVPAGEKVQPTTPAGLHSEIEDDIRNAMMEVSRRA